MQHQPRRSGIVILAFIAAMLVIGTLAFYSTTWAAPGAQGTVPTPPRPTDVPVTVSPPDDGGGGNDNGGNNDNNNNGGGDQNNGGNDGGNNGGDGGGNNDGGNQNTVQPTAAPAAAGTGSVCAIGEGGAQCAAGDLIIIVGAGAANAGSALTIEGSFPQPPCPASPSAHTFLNRCYRYTWIGTDAQPLSAVNAPVQYCINYSPTELAAVNNNAEAFVLGVANADGAWSVLKPTIDSAGSRACATTDQLIVWSALFAPQAPTSLLPTVGGAQDYMWVLALAGFGILLLVGATRLRKN